MTPSTTRGARAALGALLLSALVAACSARPATEGHPPAETPTEEQAPTEPEAGAGADAAPAEAEIDLAGCGVRRVSEPAQCAEACEARLKLPGKGGSYCTVACATDADCGSLACPETIGACVPRCASDAACKAMGFARCDGATGACDTL